MSQFFSLVIAGTFRIGKEHPINVEIPISAENQGKRTDDIWPPANLLQYFAAELSEVQKAGDWEIRNQHIGSINGNCQAINRAFLPL